MHDPSQVVAATQSTKIDLRKRLGAAGYVMQRQSPRAAMANGPGEVEGGEQAESGRQPLLNDHREQAARRAGVTTPSRGVNRSSLDASAVRGAHRLELAVVRNPCLMHDNPESVDLRRSSAARCRHVNGCVLPAPQASHLQRGNSSKRRARPGRQHCGPPSLLRGEGTVVQDHDRGTERSPTPGSDLRSHDTRAERSLAE
jgi:hypothetical protein